MSHHAAATLTVHLLRAHDAVAARLRDQRGQGTVEYVGLILLVAGVLAAVVAWAMAKSGDSDKIGSKIVKQINSAIDHTSKGRGGK